MSQISSEPPAKPAQKHFSPQEKEDSMKRLSKRLSYILRYGAVKEGLTVDENGFMPFDEVMQLSLLSEYSHDEVMNEIENSLSHRITKRYESRDKDGRIEVRAAYMRRFEESPVHPGTNVKTLVETAMTHVMDNLDDFDLEDFPDEDIIRRMFHRLKRRKKLTVKALQTLLVPTLTRIDMEGVLLTNNVVRTMCRQCPNLKQISLQGCGYIMTDAMLSQIIKNLPGLEKLNLSRCNHLTAQCLNILAKRLLCLTTLYAACVPGLSFKSALDFLNNAKSLTFLDIFYLRSTSEEYDQLTSTAASKGVTLILKRPKDEEKPEDFVVSPEVTLEGAYHSSVWDKWGDPDDPNGYYDYLVADERARDRELMMAGDDTGDDH